MWAMIAGHGNLFAACLLLTLAGCASSGAAGSAAALAPPPGQPPANVYIAAAPAVGPPPTLIDFLGITECKQHTAQAFGGISNFVHRLFPMLSTAFPGAEGPPALQPLSSPANLESPSPAVAAAAKIKQEEDQAQQKILALNYLATIGCGGCYPEVEEAFLAAMEDCTEEVRYAAVKAIKEAAGQPCTFCKSGACCSTDVRRKLIELSEDQGDDCCLAEPSPRIRRLARIALANCGNQPLEPIPDIEGPIPTLEWEVVPPAEGPREFSAEKANQSTDTSAVVTAEDSSTVAVPEATESDSKDVETLVTKWYRTVDPTLTIEQKQRLLRRYLAKQFREQAEEKTLIQVAKDEFVFRSGLKEAFASTAPQRLVSPSLPKPGRRDVISTVSHTESSVSARSSQPARSSRPAQRMSSENEGADIRVSWEQIRLKVEDGRRDQDLKAMNEIWRVINNRDPDPTVRIDENRLNVSTSGLVDLRDVPNERLRNLLATIKVGKCSPVITTSQEMFIIRVLDRRSDRSQGPKGLE